VLAKLAHLLVDLGQTLQDKAASVEKAGQQYRHNGGHPRALDETLQGRGGSLQPGQLGDLLGQPLGQLLEPVPIQERAAGNPEQLLVQGLVEVLAGLLDLLLVDLRSEEHTSELQSRENLVCRILLEEKNILEED